MKKLLLAILMPAMFAPAYATEPCLRMGEIYNWKVVNDRTLIVENLRHNKFKLGLAGVCSGLRFHQALAFKAFGGTQLSCLSRGDSVLAHDVVGP